MFIVCKSNHKIDQALNTFQVPWNFNTSLIQTFQFDKAQPEHTPCSEISVNYQSRWPDLEMNIYVINVDPLKWDTLHMTFKSQMYGHNRLSGCNVCQRISIGS